MGIFYPFYWKQGGHGTIQEPDVRLPHERKRGYPNIKAYILGEKRAEIKKDYISYLRGHYFPRDLEFLNNKRLRLLSRKKAYKDFIEVIKPYEGIKYVFRRGVLPLLHILHDNGQRTDMGLLRKNYPYLPINLRSDILLVLLLP